MQAAMSGVTHLATLVLLLLAGGCGGHAELWRYGGHTIIRDESSAHFELVQQYGSADKSANWGPMETIVRRIDGRTGRILHQNRTWGRPEPQPDVVFGWKGDLVLYDHDVGVFIRSRDVLSDIAFANPTDRLLEVASLNAATPETGRRSVHVPGVLMRFYPRPLLGPAGFEADGPFLIRSLNLDDMATEEIAIPHPTDELDVFDDILVSKHGELLTGYSVRGKHVWQASAAGNEHLPSHNLWDHRNRGAHLRINSKVFVTTCETFGQRASTVVIRRASDGGVAWTKDIELASPDRVAALGPYVIFVGSREYPTVIQGQPASRYESHWWVWDQDGNEIATGVEPAWKAEYAFRGGAAATRVGVAFDARRSTLVVGAGLDAALIRDSKVIKRLTGIPGEPLFLDDDVLVCRGETSHFAVRLELP